MGCKEGVDGPDTVHEKGEPLKACSGSKGFYYSS